MTITKIYLILIVLINEQFQIDLESYIKNQSSEISLTGFVEMLF